MKNLILEEIKLLKEKNKMQIKTKRGNSKDDALSEKSSVSGKSSKTQSTIVRSGLDLFKSMKFCFPVTNIDLSPKRIEIITKTIQIEGGIVVLFQDKIIEEAIDYLLVSPTLRIDVALKKVEKKINFKEILDFNFILNSIREGVLLAI
jgi:hypothetical protein